MATTRVQIGTRGLTRGETWRDSPLSASWRRLRRSKVVLACGIYLLLMVIVAIAAPLVASHDPLAMAPRDRFQGPSRAHLCGTDEFGRDVCSRLIYGARISLEVGVISVGIALAVGATLGLVAGYYGGLIDAVIGR